MSLNFNQAIIIGAAFWFTTTYGRIALHNSFLISVPQNVYYNGGFLIASPYVTTWKGVARARTRATLPSLRWRAHFCLCVMYSDISQTFHVGCHGVGESQYLHDWVWETWLTTLFLDTEGWYLANSEGWFRGWGLDINTCHLRGLSVCRAGPHADQGRQFVTRGPATIKEMCWGMALNLCVLMCWAHAVHSRGHINCSRQ